MLYSSDLVAYFRKILSQLLKWWRIILMAISAAVLVSHELLCLRWWMAMFSHYQGYRPILDAMKTFAVDGIPAGTATTDIEVRSLYTSLSPFPLSSPPHPTSLFSLPPKSTPLSVLPSLSPCSNHNCNSQLQDLGSGAVLCPSTGHMCKGQCRVRMRVESDPQWFCPPSLKDLAALYNANSDKKIKLIAGDTGRGVYV